MSLALAPLDVSVELEANLPCRKFDPDLWFSDSPAQLELAKSLCSDCPLRVECLAGAVERNEPWGVWGGEIFERGGGHRVPEEALWRHDDEGSLVVFLNP